MAVDNPPTTTETHAKAIRPASPGQSVPTIPPTMKVALRREAYARRREFREAVNDVDQARTALQEALKRRCLCKQELRCIAEFLQMEDLHGHTQETKDRLGLTMVWPVCATDWRQALELPNDTGPDKTAKPR